MKKLFTTKKTFTVLTYLFLLVISVKFTVTALVHTHV